MPAAKRGTYLAFATNGTGRAHLRDLEEAGLTTVHLLPTFDIASIQEDRRLQEQPLQPDCDLASYAPDSDQQQACVTAVADADGFNWGYDPLHWSTPEGSYAVNADGGARVAEFRTMVGALHADGLQVVLDQVFNHTTASGQSPQSVLDRVVPGYYQRLERDRQRRDVDLLPEHRHGARDGREGHGRLRGDLGPRLQGRRVPVRPHGPPLGGEHARPCGTRSTS